MRVCSSCGRENPDDRDFCECGEYLRWDPTGVHQALTPEVLQAAQQQARRARPRRRRPRPRREAPAGRPRPSRRIPPPAPRRPSPRLPWQRPGRDRPGAPPPAPCRRPPRAPPGADGAAARGSRRAGDPAAPAAPAQPAEPDPAAISLRLPEGEQVNLGETLAMGVEPGQRARVLALVRNQSGIVDNYELSVRGLPSDWWSIYPNTVYLVPFGTSGTYEQEVEIHFHPPRSAEAEARIWEPEVVGDSKAYNREAAVAPLHLGIQPFEEFKTKLSPERASGRKKAEYDVRSRTPPTRPTHGRARLSHRERAEDPVARRAIVWHRPTGSRSARPGAQRVQGHLDASILIIEHDMPLLTGISDRLIALDIGRFVTSGSPDEVLSHPQVVSSYLGERDDGALVTPPLPSAGRRSVCARCRSPRSAPPWS